MYGVKSMVNTEKNVGSIWVVGHLMGAAYWMCEAEARDL